MLSAIEKLCDDMLLETKWFVPVLTETGQVTDKKGVTKTQVTDDMQLLDTILQKVEQKFEDMTQEHPNNSVAEGEIAADYSAEVEAMFKTLQARAASLSFFAARSRVLTFTANYNHAHNTYDIYNIQLRPCVWETGLVRQLTDYAVKGLQDYNRAQEAKGWYTEAKPVSLRFRLFSFSAYVVSLTMEDSRNVFVNKTPLTSFTEAIYLIPSTNFETWNHFYTYEVDPKYKKPFSTDDLKHDTARFDDTKKKFRALSWAWRRFLENCIKTTIRKPTPQDPPAGQEPPPPDSA